MSKSLLVGCLLVHLMVQWSSVLTNENLRLPPLPQGDGVDYENIAWNLARGKGFGFDWNHPEWRSAYEAPELADRYSIQLSRSGDFFPTTARPPLFPWILSVIYQVIPRGPNAWMSIRLFNASCLAISGFLATWMVGKLLWENRCSQWSLWVGAIATTLFAVADRTTRTYAIDFLTEPLALLLTQSFVLLLLFVIAHRWYRWSWILAGLMIALMVYARSIFIFLVPPIAILLWIITRNESSYKESSGDNPTSIRRIGWIGYRWSGRVVTVAFVLLAPWWLRNCMVLEAWMPLGTQGPITMLGGYCDESIQAKGEWKIDAELRLRLEAGPLPEESSQRERVQREVELAQRAVQKLRGWAWEHRAELPYLMLQRGLQLWGPYSGRSLFWKIWILVGVYWLCRSGQKGAWLIVGFPLVTTIVVMALYSTGSRFLLPCFGLLYGLAGIGCAATLEFVASSFLGRFRRLSGG